MNKTISKYILYYPIQFFRKERVQHHLKQLRGSQWFGKQELEHLQISQLKKLLKYAFLNVPYYKNLFNRINFKPDKMNLIGDILSIPLLSKHELLSHKKEFISISCNDKVDLLKTSGSSGIPLKFYKTRDACARKRAIMYRYYDWYGIDIGDKQLRFFGHPTSFFPKLREDIQDLILNKYRLDPVFLTEENMLRFYQKVSKNNPDYIYGYPSAIYEFAEFLDSRGYKPAELQLKAVITSGEILHDFQRKLIEGVFGTHVVNEFGCTEHGIMAFQCEYGNMHLSADNLYIEILKDGKPASPGETGEIIVTELFNFDTPLIRYRIGDMAALSENQDCGCGRKLPIIKKIKGRVSEIILLPDGRKIHSEIFHYISDTIHEETDSIKHFKVIQEDYLSFVIQVVPKAKLSTATTSLFESLFKKYIDPKVKVSFETVDKIPKDLSGKLRYFIQSQNFKP